MQTIAVFASSLAALSTCEEALPVSVAPRCTSTTLEEACSARNRLDGVDRVLRRGLNAGHLLADLVGRLRGLLRRRLHFGGDDRKALAGPARAGSMVAFSARRLVRPAIELISSTTSPMRAAALVNSPTQSLVVRALA